MSAKRLFTADVQRGVVDFDDERFHILASKIVAGTPIALVYNERATIGKFIVAWNYKEHEYNSCDWGQGHYYDDIETAVRYYENYNSADNRLQACPECDKSPRLEYACGEYLIVGTDGCSVCGNIEEMHSSKSEEIAVWNRIREKHHEN